MICFRLPSSKWATKDVEKWDKSDVENVPKMTSKNGPKMTSKVGQKWRQKKSQKWPRKWDKNDVEKRAKNDVESGPKMTPKNGPKMTSKMGQFSTSFLTDCDVIFSPFFDVILCPFSTSFLASIRKRRKFKNKNFFWKKFFDHQKCCQKSHFWLSFWNLSSNLTFFPVKKGSKFQT